jgi:hypothetical protein
VCLHEVDNPLLEVFKYANLHCMEEVGIREVANDTGNMLKQVASSMHLAQREFCIGCLGVGITDCSKQLVILPGVLLLMRDIISKLVLSTLGPKTDMSIEMM